MTTPATIARTVPDAVPGARTAKWGSLYVAEHNLRRFRNYFKVVTFTAFGTPLLYLFAFGVGIATLISDNGQMVDGVDYLTFVAPALLCSAALTVSSEEFSYTVMSGFKWNPIFEGMYATALRARHIINGLVIFVAVRILVTCAVYYAIMWAFGAVPSAWGVLGVLAALGVGMSFGTPLMAYCASLREDNGRIAMVMRFIVVPMTLFSGTMFPLTQLPTYLQPIGWLSPLWHGSQLARVASYGLAEQPWMVGVHIAALVALTAVGWAWAVRIAKRRLNK